MYSRGAAAIHGGPSTASTSNLNPPSALASYAHPPLPLAPRLTPVFTSHQSHESNKIKRQAYTSRLSTALRDGKDANISHNRPPGGPLIHRPSSSTATQALNVDTSPPSARFPAYVPRPSRVRYQHHGASNMTRGDTVKSGISSFASSQDGSWRAIPNKSSRIDLKVDADIPESTFEVMTQFRPEADYPGDVLVRCTGFNFYVHRAILYFASPFFQAVLDGDWKENHPSLHSLSDQAEDEDNRDNITHDDEIKEAQFDALDIEYEITAHSLQAAFASPRASYYTANIVLDSQDTQASSSSPGSRARANTVNSKDKSITRLDRSRSLDSMIASRRTSLLDTSHHDYDLQRLATPPPALQEDILQGNEITRAHDEREKTSRYPSRNVVAVIDLTEEAASTFQDFLCLVYPNLDLCVTWINIFELFSFADKFEVPHLRRACTSFLRAALAGRPIDAMALAERHGLEDIYREASRHVLENMPAWESDELEILSKETLLKLERKRTWFLERLLKLGLANPARDYECHAACPDPPNCARLLHERWRNQYSNAFKYGPPQPSMIWRHLRELESGSTTSSATPLIPALSACQSSSKAWVQLLFDRMYGLPTHGMTHPKFLSIKLDSDQGPKPRPKPIAEGADVSLPN